MRKTSYSNRSLLLQVKCQQRQKTTRYLTLKRSVPVFGQNAVDAEDASKRCSSRDFGIFALEDPLDLSMTKIEDAAEPVMYERED